MSRYERLRPEVLRAIMWKDLTAIRRSKSIMMPMIIVPTLLFLALPAVFGLLARTAADDDSPRLLASLPAALAKPIAGLPVREQLIVLVDGYLLAPLFLIVPLMVSAVIAGDGFAGEKERKTLEGLMHLPITEHELFMAKLLTAYLPAVLVSWLGFLGFATVSNGIAWPVMHRIFVPNRLWAIVIFWVGPAVAALGLGVMIRVSARARTTQEANQLGGAVIMPVVFLATAQATGLLFVTWTIAFTAGAALWILALLLIRGGTKRFSRDALATRV